MNHNETKEIARTDTHTWRVRRFGDEFRAERRPINPNTGKPWQAWKTIATERNAFRAILAAHKDRAAH